MLTHLACRQLAQKTLSGSILNIEPLSIKALVAERGGVLGVVGLLLKRGQAKLPSATSPPENR